MSIEKFDQILDKTLAVCEKRITGLSTTGEQNIVLSEYTKALRNIIECIAVMESIKRYKPLEKENLK